MSKMRMIECKDCHKLFETAAVNAVRCKECQKKHKLECEKLRKRALAAVRRGLPESEREVWKRSEVEFLNLSDPWSEGRLPESVTKNQLWGMP